MTPLFLIALLAVGSTTQATQPETAGDCRAERIVILKSTQPIILPGASIDTPPDDDPTTIQFFVVADLHVSAGYISEDGQVLYLPAATITGPNPDETVGARLYAQAIDRLLALKFGHLCTPLSFPEGGA